MKKGICLMLAVLLLLSFCGCSLLMQEKEAIRKEENPVRQETTLPTEPEATEPEETEEAFLQVEVIDGYYTKGDDPDRFDYECFHLPCVLAEGKPLQNVNGVLSEELMPVIQNMEMMALTYVWAQKGDAVSLVVRKRHFFNDMTTYKVYNFSAREDRLLSEEELYQVFDLTEAEGTQKLTDILRSKCDAMKPSQYNPEEMLQMLREDTLSQENIAQSQPFIGADGQLHFYSRVAVPAGAGWSHQLLAENGDEYILSNDGHEGCN